MVGSDAKKNASIFGRKIKLVLNHFRP